MSDVGRELLPPRGADDLGAAIPGELLPARVSPGLLWSYRTAFALVIAAYVVIIYIAVRAMQGSFGASPIFVLYAIVPILILGVFTLPLVPLAELPENWVLHQMPAQRRKRGLCPACAYPMPRDAALCSECGSDGRVRAIIEPSWSSLKRFMQLALIGYLLGIVVGETLIQIDEWRFRREAAIEEAALQRTPRVAIPGASAATATSMHVRPRHWPGSFATLRWTPERGFEAEAPGLGPRRVP